MASTRDMTQRIETSLHSIAAETNFLPELAAGWAEETDEQRAVWHIEWFDLMGQLTTLDSAYRAHAMTAAQSERYERLIARLREYLPILQQLSLPLPAVSLEIATSHAAD